MTEPNLSEMKRIQKEYARRAAEIPKDFYSLERAGNLFMELGKFKAVVKVLSREKAFPLTGKKILDVGCGAGSGLLDFQKLGAEQSKLFGLDLLPERIDQAKKRLPEAVLRVGEASALPWPDAYFDIVFQSTVFTSILDSSLREAVANEMQRVLKPDGIILWYDFRFNNPWNPNVRGIERKEIARLFPRCDLKIKRVTLLPPLARTLAPISWVLCLILEKTPLLNSHFLVLIRKKGQG